MARSSRFAIKRNDAWLCGLSPCPDDGTPRRPIRAEKSTNAIEIRNGRAAYESFRAQ